MASHKDRRLSEDEMRSYAEEVLASSTAHSKDLHAARRLIEVLDAMRAEAMLYRMK